MKIKLDDSGNATIKLSADERLEFKKAMEHVVRIRQLIECQSRIWLEGGNRNNGEDARVGKLLGQTAAYIPEELVVLANAISDALGNFRSPSTISIPAIPSFDAHVSSQTEKETDATIEFLKSGSRTLVHKATYKDARDDWAEHDLTGFEPSISLGRALVVFDPERISLDVGDELIVKTYGTPANALLETGIVIQGIMDDYPDLSPGLLAADANIQFRT